MRTVLKSFVAAEAIVGILLTLMIASGENDPATVSSPLFSIGAILILYAFLSGSWIRVPGRLEGPGTLENAKRQLDADRERPSRWVQLSRIAAQRGVSVQWVLSGLLLLGHGWLLLAMW